ncbi:2Fe-2S iron-sulfur cluster-binding protein [Nocardia colli]|uniref:2Fe-2S iron-sulfur cluster-binding protein n=1 Tax=Nocardia colli TaxID=2545717 RepID=UPI0035D8471B
MTPIPPLAVQLHRSGRTILVPPALTVLEALENEGVPTNSMCRAGICGTCETVARAATELRSASPTHSATEPGSASVPGPLTGPPTDRYPRPVRLCITAPGTLTHLVLDL